MGKVQFQKDVRKIGGYILSDGTLNMLHLLPKAYDLLTNYNIRNVKLKDEIISVFEIDNSSFSKTKESLFIEQYYGDARIAEGKESEANDIWNEDVYNFFSSISPNGYYFGSSEGDGACIGWFKFEREE